MSTQKPPADDNVAQWPLYWFAKLEKAVEVGDHQTAAAAQQQLARLGVQVQYGLASKRREADHAR